MEIDSNRITLDLESALKEERVEITYAPLLDKVNKTFAYLRHVRLFDPSRGLIDEFELRKTSDILGLGEKLDAFALSRSLDDLVAWNGATRHPLNMLILPIGRESFYNASFLQDMRRACVDREIPLERIALAFDGSFLADDESYCATFCRKAHALNFKIAILNFNAKCPLTRVDEIQPDVISYAPSFFKLHPILGKAEAETLRQYGKAIASQQDLFGLVPELYREKEVTSAIALERLLSEEEFRR